MKTGMFELTLAAAVVVGLAAAAEAGPREGFRPSGRIPYGRSGPVVRDHRTRPVVRDHRTPPVVRDHRTPPVVRDHRTPRTGSR